MTLPGTGQPAESPYDQLPSDECIEVAATILAAMSYPLRMRIVLHLLHQEATGADLSRTLGVDHTLLAHHLRHLRAAGILHRRRVGNHVSYGTSPPVIDVIRATIAYAEARANRTNDRVLG
jgi:DNA-binding transcriptional ArsR family regulator